MDRVLLGAIFRKLPLKLLLVILAGMVVFFACTQAYQVCDERNYGGTSAINGYNAFDFSNGQDLYCLIPMGSSVEISLDGTNYFTVGNRALFCIKSNEGYNGFYYRGGTATYAYLVSSCLDIPYTSLQCQTKYSLIPISEVDSSYCQSNNLCPSSGFPSDCPNVGVSNLWINDIFHPGAFNVIMNIPEEIDWDYAYTNSGSNINIDVVGYNQDTEYINGLIDVNNYKPTSEDFTNIFGLFSNYGGLLIACLFVILVFYFIKKAFK